MQALSAEETCVPYTLPFYMMFWERKALSILEIGYALAACSTAGDQPVLEIFISSEPVPCLAMMDCVLYLK